MGGVASGTVADVVVVIASMKGNEFICKDKLSNLGIVCALFITTSIGIIASPPDWVMDDLGHNGGSAHYWSLHGPEAAWPIILYVLLISSICLFLANIIFFAHVMNWLPRILQRDSDIFLWLLEYNIEAQVETWCVKPLIWGIITFFLAVFTCVVRLFPAYVFGWFVFGGLAVSIHMVTFAQVGAKHSRGWKHFENTVARRNRQAQLKYLLEEVYEPRAKLDPDTAHTATAS